DVLQLMTGYPTPYFLTVCKPNYTTLNVSCEQNPYVMEDICSGGDPTAINQGRKSFPSQHATLASFAAVYVSMYFNSTLTDSSKLLKPLLVFSFIICAIICGLTRIIQYKNHAIDVYLGFLLGGAIAVYLGLYAVGNFQPSEEASNSPLPQIHRPPCSLPHISQEAVLHHLQMKASMAGEPGIPASHSEGLLHRGLQQQRPGDSLKRSSADMEVISPRSPLSKEPMVTFSHTLPRVHTPQAMAAYEEAARRHAATLHHASMDSSRSKQLLSQWKSKNDSRKCSLQVPDSFSSSVDSSSGQSSQHPHHHGSMELRSSSEPTAMGLNGGFDSSSHAYMAKLATGASTTLPSNCSGITGGARISMQSRPGSSQLVHIPEEAHENYNTSPRTMGGGEGMTINSTVQANWQRAAEKTATCRTNDSGPNSQPRIMQVIAMSKQQGLLSLGSTTGSISGSTGTIVRVEAHPENNRPVIQAPSTDGSGAWRWRSLDHGSLRQSFELNDLNRDSESSESAREGSIDRKRANHVSEQSRDSTLRRKGNNVILIPERANSPDNTRNIFYKGTSIAPAFKE
uniref:Phospholipid phosphatase related 4b n=1 Tax=Myripristis murdjan TaxID=586833 RepID=A0A667X1R0_9TELE